MLADFFEGRPMPRRTVPSHGAVATALQAGLADIGAGLRLTAAAARLKFLTLRHASYDLCLHDRNLGDPRIDSLFAILHGSVLREQLADLPGYSTKSMGETKLL
jgi:molybdate-binding protein